MGGEGTKRRPCRSVIKLNCLEQNMTSEEEENTVEAPVCGHPREAEKVSATGAGRLRECVNAEFAWARVQTGFFQGGRK